MMPNNSTKQTSSNTAADMLSLAEFRYHLRRFLRFSEESARSVGLEPQQHQLLLAVEGINESGIPAAIKLIAERLQLRHQSVVGLLDRLEKRSLLSRRRDALDQRQVIITLTEAGKALLDQLSLAHRQELMSRGPALLAALQSVIRAAPPGED
jgi:DNA-binding MarR family transcriptional regulator